MKYIFVKWNHNFPDEPILLYSELGENLFETRKVEIFPDGRKGYASLSIEPIPTIEEIAKDEQFQPREISQIEFEMVWAERTINKSV